MITAEVITFKLTRQQFLSFIYHRPSFHFGIVFFKSKIIYTRNNHTGV